MTLPPSSIQKEATLGTSSTYEVQNPKGGDESIMKVVTSEYIDEILCDEDRGHLWDSLALLQERAANRRVAHYGMWS